MVEYKFQCLCGETAGTFDSDNAKAKLICHCSDCRAVNSGGVAVKAFPFAPDDVHMTKSEHLKEYKLKDTVTKYFCGNCGTKLYNSNRFGLLVIQSEIIQDPGDDLKPEIHVCYAERVCDIRDDLPKFLDFPEAFGGTGKTAEE